MKFVAKNFVLYSKDYIRMAIILSDNTVISFDVKFILTTVSEFCISHKIPDFTFARVPIKSSGLHLMPLVNFPTPNCIINDFIIPILLPENFKNAAERETRDRLKMKRKMKRIIKTNGIGEKLRSFLYNENWN